jgi:hypothetical protein
MHEKNVFVFVGRCRDAELKKQINIFGYHTPLFYITIVI